MIATDPAPAPHPVAGAPPEPFLALRDLERRHGRDGKEFVLRVASIDLSAGARLGLMGRSGHGKSTLLETLGLLAVPSPVGSFTLSSKEGEIDVAAMTRRNDAGALTRLRAARIGFLLQDGGLLPYLDVRGNAELAVRLSGARVDRARLTDLADAMGIAPLLEKMPSALSGGERRRAAVLRALAPGGDLLICDEPTTGLDEETAAEVMTLIDVCARTAGATVVVASHDEGLMKDFGYHVARLVKRIVDGVPTATLDPVSV